MRREQEKRKKNHFKKMKEKEKAKISRLHKTDYKNMEILPPHKEVHGVSR